MCALHGGKRGSAWNWIQTCNYHIKLGELSETYPTIRVQKKTAAMLERIPKLNAFWTAERYFYANCRKPGVMGFSDPSPRVDWFPVTVSRNHWPLGQRVLGLMESPILLWHWYHRKSNLGESDSLGQSIRQNESTSNVDQRQTSHCCMSGLDCILAPQVQESDHLQRLQALYNCVASWPPKSHTPWRRSHLPKCSPKQMVLKFVI